MWAGAPQTHQRKGEIVAYFQTKKTPSCLRVLDSTQNDKVSINSYLPYKVFQYYEITEN